MMTSKRKGKIKIIQIITIIIVIIKNPPLEPLLIHNFSVVPFPDASYCTGFMEVAMGLGGDLFCAANKSYFRACTNSIAELEIGL